MSDFKDRVVVITGAGGGLGKAHALEFAKRGAKVVVNDLGGRGDGTGAGDAADLVVKEIKAAGGTAIANKASVATKEGAKSIIDDAVKAFGTVHILVNNAGIMPLSPLLEDRVDEWEQTIDVNLKGLLYTTRAVLGDMARRKEGHIVNLSSVAGRYAFPGGAVYCATKFAVRAISDGLRREVLSLGIRVTDIEPGAVSTELIDSVHHEGSRQALTGEGGFYAQKDILRDVDIANAILYAVSQPPRVDVSELLIRPTIQAF